MSYLVSGGVEPLIHIWDYNTYAHVKYFKGHRGPINGLAFRLGTLQLFSASEDKTLKVSFERGQRCLGGNDVKSLLVWAQSNAVFCRCGACRR